MRSIVEAEREASRAAELRVQPSAEARQKAVRAYAHAADLYSSAGDAFGEAEARANLGFTHQVLGETRAALEQAERAIPLYQAAGYARGEAEALNNQGSAFNTLGEKERALVCYRRALPLFEEVGDVRVQAIVLNNIGTVYKDLGRPAEALDFYRRSLPLRRKADDARGEATTLANAGVVYRMMGEHQKALDAYQEALVLVRRRGDKELEAWALQNLAAVYVRSGESRKALPYLESAAKTLRDTGDRKGEANALNGLGVAHRLLGESETARRYLQQALELRRASRDSYGEGVTLGQLGSLELANGQDDEAQRDLTRALEIRRSVGDRNGEAYALSDLATLHRQLGDTARALDEYRQALELSRATSDIASEAGVLHRLARAAAEDGDLTAARRHAEAALELFESLRAKLAGPALRASSFASAQETYELYIDVLMRLHGQNPGGGLDRLALEASERKRARVLLDLVAEAEAGIHRGGDARLLEQERALRARLSAYAQKRGRPGARRQAEDEAAARELQSLLTDSERLDSEIRSRSPAYAALTRPSPLSVAGIQGLLDPDTGLLEFSLGKERSHLWVVTAQTVRAQVLPPRDRIEAVAARMHDLLEPPEPQGVMNAGRSAALAQTATELGQMLLGGVPRDLLLPRIVVVAEGALHRVPFAALALPGAPKPLVAEHEVINLPSASVMAVVRAASARQSPAREVAILADPVFEADDPRLHRRPARAQPSAMVVAAAREIGLATPGRLPFSRQEAYAIRAAAAPGSVMTALDFSASRATVARPELAAYRTVHFATHGFVNDEHPDLSGLVLSLFDARGRPQDGFLRLYDIYNLDLPVELVVLSACHSGQGREQRGEGLLGLVRGIMYAGSPRVLASLGRVDDRATAELMKHFYRALLRQRLTPAAALRSAQLAMMRKERFRDPAYWANFVLHGEWR
jgi:CHAT domain-containing protein/Tfp pilus assembly protein PilF